MKILKVGGLLVGVDVCDRPYPEMTRAARKLGGELYVKRQNGVWQGDR